VREVVTNAGTQFDPNVVEAFEKALPEILALWTEIKPAAEPEVGKRLNMAV
jgi:HD-GYP domain-containing protein (c-di-GMP phosphodiesterase class II)